MTEQELKILNLGANWGIAKTPPTADPPRETCVDAAKWLAEEDEPDTPLVVNLIERGEMVAIVGQSKAGKSFLALQLAAAIAVGRPFLDRETVRENVYVANLEVSRKQYKKRLKRLVRAIGITAADLEGRLFIDNMKGENATWKNALEKCKRLGCKVAVIDPFYQIFKGDEVSAEDCQRAIDHMKEFQRAGITLIVVFHSPKGFSGDRQLIDMISGSSMLARFPESIIGILNHAKDRKLRVVKCILRNYAPPDDQTIRYDDGQFVVMDEVEAEVESAETHAKKPQKSDAEKAADFARACSYWAKEIRARFVGVPTDDIRAEIMRSAGFSKTRANAVIGEIRLHAADHDLHYDDEYGTFTI